MNGFLTNIKNHLSALFFALALLCLVISLFVRNSALDTEDVAARVSRKTSKRVELLEEYAGKVLASAPNRKNWLELKSFPEDMVIYRYQDDTLYSWYNLFDLNNDQIGIKEFYQRISSSKTGLSSPLSTVKEHFSYMNIGSKWYLVREQRDGRCRLIEGLLVKDDAASDAVLGDKGLNGKIAARGLYDFTTLSDDGSVVCVNGHPVFKIASVTYSGDSFSYLTYIFRWLAILLVLCAVITSLMQKKSVTRCFFSMLAIIVLMVAALFLGKSVSAFDSFFSPTYFAVNEILSSLGALLIINLAIFTCVVCIYVCRFNFALRFASRKASFFIYSASLLLLLALLLSYSFYVIVSLIYNSELTQQFARTISVATISVPVFLSFAFLLSAAPLLFECLLENVNQAKNKTFSIMGRKGRLATSCILALSICICALQAGFLKEQSLVRGWSNRLAVDRNLMMELQLRRVEMEIASDPVIFTFAHMDNSRNLIARRLDEMYLGHIARDYDVSIYLTRQQSDPVLNDILEHTVPEGDAIDQDSHFLYNYSTRKGSRYTGFFNFYSPTQGPATLIIELTPKSDEYAGVAGRRGSGVRIPPLYSYAKYGGDKLVSFKGSYPYPLVLDGLFSENSHSKESFVLNGYRHFVNNVSDEETIVMSRRERGPVNYLVSFSYIAILLYLVLLIFGPKQSSLNIPRYFSVRMRRLIVLSLSITLIMMAFFSVLFVYQRNKTNRLNRLSSNISTVQIILNSYCRQITDCSQLNNHAFLQRLDEASKNLNADICVYSPSGKMLMCNAPDAGIRRFVSYRMEPEAYRNIIFNHQRYYILDRKTPFGHVNVMFAPVFNERGDVIAIAGMHNSFRDYDFTRDAVFHAALILSLFIILLFFTILIASSITTAMFKPLSVMSKKMSNNDDGNLEPIEYDGNDEIAPLVDAYNKMVGDLKESAGKLAVAERDKAWSEMSRQVAHEIKNPLTPIKLEIQRLQRLKQRGDSRWEEVFDESLDVVLEHIDILSNTASEFSTYAKLYTEEPAEINLDKLLIEQLSLYENRDDLKVTYLGFESAGIFGPKPQIIRMIVNLLTNSQQALEGRPDATILVSLRQSADAQYWELSVEDNGPGVPEEHRERMFEPNFTTKSGGTGLGLALCRSVAEKCGGSIAYSTSFSLGGACFTVRLPKYKA